MQLRNVRREARGSVKLGPYLWELHGGNSRLPAVAEQRGSRGVARRGSWRRRFLCSPTTLAVASSTENACLDLSTSRGRSGCRTTNNVCRAVIVQALQVFARPGLAVSNPKMPQLVVQENQGAFGDIWGSGHNARVLATRPMHETIRISHQSKGILEPIRDAA